MIRHKIYFGIQSQIIEDISDCYVEMVIEQHAEGERPNTEGASGTTTQSARINATAEFIGSASRSMEGYTVSHLSLFHSPDLRVQGSTAIFVKINSDCDGVKNALIAQGATTGYTFATVYPDTINLSINGQSNFFNVQGNDYSPQEGETSINLTVPFYTSILGFQTFETQVTMSKTSVTKTKVGTGQYNNNIISWKIEKTMDGKILLWKEAIKQKKDMR